MDEPLDNVGKLRRAYQLWHDTRGVSAQHWLDLMAEDVRMGSVTDGGHGMPFTKANHGKADEKAFYPVHDDPLWPHDI